LAVSISKLHRWYLLWLRPEQVQAVEWAGEPAKSVEIHPDGWFVMVQELGDRVQVNPAHVVAIEE
jgi:light-regulated signal transduction histidine kinase (bacteriophytochrome)